MFRLFLGFLVVAGLTIHQVTVTILLAFMESLVDQSFSVSNIVNYMAGIRSNFIIYGLDTLPFRDERIYLFQKSLKYTRKLVPKGTFVIDTDLLLCILSVSDTLEFPIIYRALYLLSFFSFLRLSNILPHTIKGFDPTRQLCKGDLIFSQDSIVIIIKWSKTIQNRRDTVTISVPSLGDSPLCPHRALKAMLLQLPGSSNDPLFQIPRNGGFVPLTDSVARKHLKKCQWCFNWPPLPSHFICFADPALHGHSTMGFPSRILCPMVLGPPTVSGVMYLPYLSTYHPLLLPSNSTYIYSSLGCLGLLL